MVVPLLPARPVRPAAQRQKECTGKQQPLLHVIAGTLNHCTAADYSQHFTEAKSISHSGAMHTNHMVLCFHFQ